MQRGNVLGRVEGHPRRDQRSPVAALDRVALVAKPLAEELTKAIRHRLDPDRAGRLVGERVSRERRDDHVVAGRDQLRDQVEELDRAAWPAVHETDRQPLRAVPSLGRGARSQMK